MMKINHALYILQVRRAFCILYMIAVACGGYWYVHIANSWMADNSPQLAGVLMTIAVVSLGAFWMLLFYWLCRLCSGIWWLSGIKRRHGACDYWTCPITFRVRFKAGAYDFL
jgi:hypothetical protein